MMLSCARRCYSSENMFVSTSQTKDQQLWSPAVQRFCENISSEYREDFRGGSFRLLWRSERTTLASALIANC